MKQTILAMTTIAILFACTPTEKTAILSGKIINPSGDKALVLGDNDFKAEFALAEDGSFSDTLVIPEDGLYMFSDGRERSQMYLKKGQSMSVTVDTKEFDETIAFDGEGAVENNYMAAAYMRDEQGTDTKTLYSMSEADFLAKSQEIKDTELGFLTKAAGIDADFMSMMTKDLDYGHLSRLANFEEYHAYFADAEDFKVTDDFPDAYANVNLDCETSYKTSANYKNLINSYYTAGSTPEIAEKTKTITSSNIKKSLAKNLAYRLTPGDKDMATMYQTIASMTDGEEEKKELEQKYEKLKLLVAGELSPSFKYEDVNGNQIGLDDLKGKNVYIDVWATWCGPCKAEIPHLKEMEAKMHDDNIEFVSISIDKATDKDKWLNMVSDKELKGVQLMADKDWSSDFVQDYAIEGIPRFILVDDKGKIVSADAPRPSNQTELQAIFKDLSI